MGTSTPYPDYESIKAEIAGLDLYTVEVVDYLYNNYSFSGLFNKLFKEIYEPHINEHIKFLKENPFLYHGN